MKRIFLISFLLLFIGTMYADGPRYRFKSRRALQSLWRKEMRENPKGYYGKSRNLSSREQSGEGVDGKADKFQYGIVVADPFSGTKLGDMDDGNDDDRDNGFYVNPGEIGKVTDNGGLRPAKDPTKDNPNPYIQGQTGSGEGWGKYEPPGPPVGDGLHILLILSAALVAIKKRLSK